MGSSICGDIDARPHHVVLFPFMSKGHIIPILHLTRLLLHRRLAVTIFTTQANHAFITESLRLCLVAVKRFPENTYFPEMLISGKGKCFHVFGCISKNFPENIFWCLEKKKENTNQKTQATSHNPEKKNH